MGKGIETRRRLLWTKQIKRRMIKKEWFWMTNNKEEEHCHYSGLPSPMAYENKKANKMNKNKEAVMLSKVIVGIAGLISIAVYPPIVLLGVTGYAGWILYKHYTV